MRDGVLSAQAGHRTHSFLPWFLDVDNMPSLALWFLDDCDTRSDKHAFALWFLKGGYMSVASLALLDDHDTRSYKQESAHVCLAYCDASSVSSLSKLYSMTIGHIYPFSQGESIQE